MANNKALNLTIKVNGQEVDNTFKAINGHYHRLRNSVNKLTEGTEEWEEANRELAKVEAHRKGMIERQRAYREEIKKTTDAQEENNVSFSEFKQSASDAFSSLLSGDLIGAQEGIHGVTNGLRGATKAAWAFIATPIGAAIAALAAIAGSAKFLWDYNAGLEKMNQELRALGISAEEMDTVRSEVEAVAETYEKEFDEIAKKAKGLSEAFGISMSEALDEISRGLADGGKMNSEFMDSLGEYDIFFAQAGYSAQQFIDIVNQGFELGIYSDKLPDAIKEAGLSLQEQTTATRDALVNAFGAAFTDEILSKIDKGEITVREGLEAIASQSKKTGLTQQQQAQLTADVFRGAGEDAGGAMKILEAVSQAAQREMSATATAQEELKEANERLNKVQSQLFGISGFGELWVKIKTSAVNAIYGMLQGLQNLKIMGAVVATEVTNFFIGMANRTVGSFQALVETVSPALKTIGVDVANLQKSLQSLKLEEVNFVASLAPIPEPSTPEPDPIKMSYEPGQLDVEAEAQKRAESEKAIRERVETVLKDWAAERKEGEEIDPLEKMREMASKELQIFEEKEEKKTEIKKRQGEERNKLESFFSDFEKKIKENQVEWSKLSEDQKLDAVKGGLAAASQAFNKGSAAWKAAKIAETTIATYQGAQNAFTSLAAIPIVGPALGTAAAAAAIIAGLQQVQKISSTKIPKAPGFARGGFTDQFGLGYTDETGHEPAGIVHKNEYVVPEFMRKEPEVPQILGYLETKRKKKLGLYADGGDVEGGSTSAAVLPAPYSQQALMQLIERFMEKLDQPLEAPIYFGMEAELKRQEQQKKLEKIQQRSKIKTE